MSGSAAGRQTPTSIHSHPEDEGPYGLRGAAGNVRDWCRGEHVPEGATQDGERSQEERQPEAASMMASCRGGMHYGTEAHVHLCSRFHVPPGVRSDGLGFRLARPWGR
jgi:serine/threonine-protein kinase